MGAWIAFTVLAVLMVGGSAMVVLSTDLVRSVFWLAGVLILTGVLYVTLSADFVAAVQLLLYTGGVVTLMLFAVMLTRRLSGAHILIESIDRLKGLFMGLAVFLIVLTGVWTGLPWHVAAPDMVADTQGLGAIFLSPVQTSGKMGLLLPFELLSLLLRHRWSIIMAYQVQWVQA